MPHGRAWRILDRERLVRDVIPKYFSSSKYHSFCRQLNWWGFKRLCGPGPDMGCYYHQCFLRDLPELTCLIRRTTTNEGRLKPHIEGEPNFYRISEEYPLPPQLRKTSIHLLAPRGSSSDENNKERAVSIDSSGEATTKPVLVQHVVSAASFVAPENYRCHNLMPPSSFHEISASAPSGSSAPEETAVQAWESTNPAGYHPYYPPYYPSGFLSHHHSSMMFPPYAADQQGHWIPHGQHPPAINYHTASLFSDNGTVGQHGDTLINNGHEWPLMSPDQLCHPNFIDDGNYGDYQDRGGGDDDNEEHPAPKESSNNQVLDYDPYAPLPVEACRHYPHGDHHSHHDEKCMDGSWIDGCLAVLKVEKKGGPVTVD